MNFPIDMAIALWYFGYSSEKLNKTSSERLTIKSQAPKQNFREKF